MGDRVCWKSTQTADMACKPHLKEVGVNPQRVKPRPPHPWKVDSYRRSSEACGHAVDFGLYCVRCC